MELLGVMDNLNYEIELEKAIKRLKDIQLALNESSIVPITDSKGIIQFANDKFCEISKYSKEELEGSNQNSEIIVKTIIFMGNQMKLNIIAEGIENKEQLLYLKQQNCHEGQGYYWSQPVSEEEFQKIYYSKLKQPIMKKTVESDCAV